MKALTSLLMTGLLLAGATGCRAADHDFNGVVDGLEQHYGIHGHRIPMMGFAGFIAGIATHGGVRGLRVAEFNHMAGSPVDADDLGRFISEQLGSEWRPVVKDREQHGRNQTVIFVRPAGHAMRMLIADYENGELNVVRVELDGAELAKWMKEPGDPTRHSRHEEGERVGDEAESRAQ